jgi:glycosyltransferase involved in cell wall biosynthesis
MNRRLNIAIVSDVFPPKSGGSGWSSFYLSRALQQRGHNVRVVVPKEGEAFGETRREYEGLPVTEFIYPAIKKIPFARNYTRNERLYPRFASWLAKFFQVHEIEVAHGQHYLTIPPVTLAAQKTGVVSLGTIRDYWPVCYWTTRLSGEKVCPGCTALNRLKCLYRNQGPAGIAAAPLSLYMASNLRLKQRVLAQTDTVLAVSTYVAQSISPFVPVHRLRIIPTFIDLEDLHSKVSGLPDAAEPYLFYLGKLETNKGAQLLLEVLKQARPDITTLVAGEGSLKAEMEAVAKQEGLKVKFLGWVEHDEALRLLARAEALLFTSLWPEPLSRVLLEAVGVGALTVAINTGGTPDIFQDGVNGLLASNVTEMTVKLKEILKPENEGLRHNLRANAVETARYKFSQPVVIEQTEQLYYELLEQKRGAAV